MKASKLAVLLSLGSLLAVAASAKTLEETYIDSCSKDPSVPTPIAVVSPHVSSDYAGSTVMIEFNVTSRGEPTDIIVKSAPNGDVGSAVTAAVKQWQFKPALRNGVPVDTRVVLPVRIVSSDVAGARYASN